MFHPPKQLSENIETEKNSLKTLRTATSRRADRSFVYNELRNKTPRSFCSIASNFHTRTTDEIFLPSPLSPRKREKINSERIIGERSFPSRSFGLIGPPSAIFSSHYTFNISERSRASIFRPNETNFTFMNNLYTSSAELGIRRATGGRRIPGREHLSAFLLFLRGRREKETSALIESDTISENNRCPLVARVLGKESLREYLGRFHGKPFVVLETLGGDETTGAARRENSPIRIIY